MYVTPTVCLVTRLDVRFHVFVFVLVEADLGLQRRRPDDAPEALQALVEIYTPLSWCLRSGVLGILFDPERGEVPRDRALKMPRRHDVLLSLRSSLLVPLAAHGLLVLVSGQHDADAVLLASLARRACHFQALTWLSGGLLSSSVQRKVLGDVLRYLETYATNGQEMAAMGKVGRLAYWGMTISSLFRRPSRIKRI